MNTITDRDATARQTLSAGDDQVISVVEEFANVSVERRDAGGVRVRLVTDEVNDLHQIDLSSERVEITRLPVDREIDAIPAPREDGDLLIVPVVEERAVVVTKLFLTEEIHIRRNRQTDQVQVPVTLRRQQAVIEQLAPATAGLEGAGIDRLDP